MTWALIDTATVPADLEVSFGNLTDTSVLHKIVIDVECSSGGVGFRVNDNAISNYWTGSFYINMSQPQGSQYADSSRYKAEFIVVLNELTPAVYRAEFFSTYVFFDRDSNPKSEHSSGDMNDYFNKYQITSLDTFNLKTIGSGAAFTSGTIKLYKRTLP